MPQALLWAWWRTGEGPPAEMIDNDLKYRHEDVRRWLRAQPGHPGQTRLFP